jgi:hypothetical protein
MSSRVTYAVPVPLEDVFSLGLVEVDLVTGFGALLAFVGALAGFDT